MERHSRKFEVLPSTKMLPCATICWIEHPRNQVLGTSWFLSKLQTHSIASTKKLFAPCSHKSTWASEIFNEHLKLQVIVIVGLNFLQKIVPKSQITNKEMFAECQVMFLFHLFHCLLYQFLHLCRRSVTFLGNIFTISLTTISITTASSLCRQYMKVRSFNRIMPRNKGIHIWYYVINGKTITLYI